MGINPLFGRAGLRTKSVALVALVAADYGAFLSAPTLASVLANSGARAGDLCLVWGITNSVATSGQQWTNTPSAGNWPLFWRRLSQADIAAGISANGVTTVAIYRGPTAIGAKRTSGGGNGGATMPGFVKSNFASALVFLGLGVSNSAPPGIGTPWTYRNNWMSGGFNAESRALYDLIPADLYVNGSAIGFGGSSNGQTYGAVHEFLF